MNRFHIFDRESETPGYFLEVFSVVTHTDPVKSGAVGIHVYRVELIEEAGNAGSEIGMRNRKRIEVNRDRGVRRHDVPVSADPCSSDSLSRRYDPPAQRFADSFAEYEREC